MPKLLCGQRILVARQPVLERVVMVKDYINEDNRREWLMKTMQGRINEDNGWSRANEEWRGRVIKTIKGRVNEDTRWEG